MVSLLGTILVGEYIYRAERTCLVYKARKGILFHNREGKPVRNTRNPGHRPWKVRASRQRPNVTRDTARTKHKSDPQITRCPFLQIHSYYKEYGCIPHPIRQGPGKGAARTFLQRQAINDRTITLLANQREEQCQSARLSHPTMQEKRRLQDVICCWIAARLSTNERLKSESSPIESIYPSRPRRTLSLLTRRHNVALTLSLFIVLVPDAYYRVLVMLCSGSDKDTDQTIQTPKPVR